MSWRDMAVPSTMSHKSTCCIWSSFQKGAAKGFRVRGEKRKQVSKLNQERYRVKSFYMLCWCRINWGLFYSCLSSQGWKKLFQGLRSVIAYLVYHRHTVLRLVEAASTGPPYLTVVFPDINSMTLICFIFPFLSPGREPPTRPASCGMKMMGEFCGFLFTFTFAFWVKTSQF